MSKKSCVAAIAAVLAATGAPTGDAFMGPSPSAVLANSLSTTTTSNRLVGVPPLFAEVGDKAGDNVNAAAVFMPPPDDNDGTMDDGDDDDESIDLETVEMLGKGAAKVRVFVCFV